jgi:GT2 family glycosyltransferase
MVQPFASYLEFNCGKTYQDFNEEKLLKGVNKIKFDDFQGSHWQPSLIPKKTWDKVGGFSEEFSPGLGSDPDFNMKLWNIGVRIFKGVNNCKVYHFGSMTLRKKINVVNKDKNYGSIGSKIFLLKWGITIKFFKKFYLKSNTIYDGPLKKPKINFIYIFQYILNKINYFYIKFLYKNNF